jgi:hypothetical protein
MTRADYETAARMIHNIRVPDQFSHPKIERVYRESIASLFAKFFNMSSGPRFDTQKFLDNCLPKKDED